MMSLLAEYEKTNGSKKAVSVAINRKLVQILTCKIIANMSFVILVLDCLKKNWSILSMKINPE